MKEELSKLYEPKQIESRAHELWSQQKCFHANAPENTGGSARSYTIVIPPPNVTAALHVVHAVLPGMIERRGGHMVQIGSIAGLYPLLASLYGASKGAIHLMSQNLRMELAGSGIRNTEICPGRAHTEFFDTAIDDEERRKSMVKGFELMQPQDIADAIVFALDAPWRVNISTIEMTPNEQAPGGLIIEPVARD